MELNFQVVLWVVIFERYCCLHLHPNDEDSKVFRNFSNLPQQYMALQPRRARLELFYPLLYMVIKHLLF
jgi:hypothetical protein